MMFHWMLNRNRHSSPLMFFAGGSRVSGVLFFPISTSLKNCSYSAFLIFSQKFPVAGNLDSTTVDHGGPAM